MRKRVTDYLIGKRYRLNGFIVRIDEVTDTHIFYKYEPDSPVKIKNDLDYMTDGNFAEFNYFLKNAVALNEISEVQNDTDN